MPNLYGVANAPGLPVLYNTIGGVDVALAAGVETNFIDTGVITAPSGGFFYPVAWLGVVLSFGATAPTSLNLNLRVNSGADQASIGLNVVFLVANTNLLTYYPLVGTPSQIFAPGAGAHVQLSGLSAAQPTTARFAGTWVMIALFRAPDQ